jgi:hypothetical protein
VLVRASGGSWRARVAIAAFDGTVVEAGVAAPLGHPDHPASDDDLCRKWDRICGGDRAASVFDRLARARSAERFSTVLAEGFGPAHPVVGLLRPEAVAPVRPTARQ